LTHQTPRRTRRIPAARDSSPAEREPSATSAATPASAHANDGNDADDGSSDRPTVNPPFDLEAFARASAMGSSDPAPLSGSHYFPSETPTARPPPPEFTDGERTERITLTNEVELENARASSLRPTNPPRHNTPSALSIANARVPSAPNFPAARGPTPTSIEAAVLGIIGSGPGPEITEHTIEDPIAEMRERLSLGDYTGAFEMAELLLAEDPDDVEAAECAESCREVLEGMYAARLGPLDRIPTVIVQPTQLRWLSIDHRAGFVLSLIDGSSTLEMILDVSGMAKLDALRILHELLQAKIVSLKN
jgi:hypothetical protein